MERFSCGTGKLQKCTANGKRMIIPVLVSYGILMKHPKLCLLDGTDSLNCGIRLVTYIYLHILLFLKNDNVIFR